MEKKAHLRKTVGYIEAKDGQAFTVQAQSSGNPPTTDIACGVYVDGRRYARPFDNALGLLTPWGGL